MENTKNKAAITIMAMITVLIFFSIQGTAVILIFVCITFFRISERNIPTAEEQK